MKKLKKTRGESIAETLVALLIASLGLMILAGAITTAAKINADLKNDEVVFREAQASVPGAVYLSSDGPGHPSATVDVQVYTTGNGYVYYEKN